MSDMSQTTDKFSRVDLDSKESRQRLAKLIMRLFERWELSTAEQLELLGLSTTSRAQLTRYRKGHAIPQSRDMRDRIAGMISIHKSLRQLFPYNENIRYTWVKRRHRMIENQTPLEVMIDQGIIGIARIARFLDFQRGI